MTTLGRSPGPGPRKPAVRLPRALWRAGFRRCVMLSQLNVSKCLARFFPIFVKLFEIFTEFEVLLLWCDITLMQMCYKGVDPAFSLGAITDTLHGFIASSILFSPSAKEKTFLIVYKQTLETSGQVVLHSQSSVCGWWVMESSIAHGHLWLIRFVRSSGLSKEVWHGSTESCLRCPATSPIHKRYFFCSQCTNTTCLGSK